MNNFLDIPDKRYFTISEVADLTKIKSHTLRFWEKEFSKLKPSTRGGNRRYYQKKDIEFIFELKSLLYEKGFTISGAKKYLIGDNKESHRLSDDKVIISELEQLLKDL
tara:strand:+ start:53412 stop:53735 length:324 start_codon:yes stop_codon:yes gene_type:complete